MESLNIIEKITKEVLNGEWSVVIAERELVECVIEELEEYNYFVENYDELFMELEDCEVLALSRCEDKFYIEYPFDEDDELEDYCGCDKAIVQDGILFDEELDELKDICDGELFVFEIIDDEELGDECDDNCDECCLDEEDIIEAKLDFVDETLEDYGRISLVTDYKTAKAIAMEYGIYDDYDYMGIDLQSDVGVYFVDITDEILVVEPIKRSNGYFTIDGEELIIDADIEDKLEDEFFEYLDVNEIYNMEIE